MGLAGPNLPTVTKYKGYDPEVGERGGLVRLDSFVYPRYRTVTGTVQVEF